MFELQELTVLDAALTIEKDNPQIKIKKNGRHRAIENILTDLKKTGKTGYNRQKK